MAQKINTQKELVLSHLRRYGTITPAQAWERYGITRLAAQVFFLREDGITIETESVQKKNRFGRLVQYARYRLVR